MKKHITYAVQMLVGMLVLVGLAACNGTSSGMGSLDLSITDTPVDGAQSVVVAYTGVDLMGPNGQMNFTFSTEQTLDLLKLQGNASAMLLNGVSVPAGG